MYNLKIIRSGNRLEIYKINNYAITTKEDVQEQQKDTTKDTTEDTTKNKINKEKKRKETLNNARNSIIRLIKSNGDMTTFITLTFANEQDYKMSKKALNNLFNKLRKKYKGLKYLWVLEYGELNNRLHYHLLCNIPIDVKLSNSKEKKSIEHKALENDFASKYWKYGFVDIRALKEEGNTNIALYVSVYITKSMENRDLEGYRIYGYSNKTLDKPIEEYFYTTNSAEEVLKQYVKDYSVKYTNSYGIGYMKEGKERTGIVTYIDLEFKN